MSQDALDESNTNTFNKFLNPSSTANHDPSTAADKETVKHSLKLDDSIAEEDLEMGNRATLGCSSSSTDFLTDSDPPFSNGQKIRSPPIKKARKLTSQLPAVKAGVDLLQNTTPLAIGQLMEGNYMHTNCMLLCLVIFYFCITFHYFITFSRVCRSWTTSS